MSRLGLPVVLSLSVLACNEYSILDTTGAQGKGEAAPLETPVRVDRVQQTEIPKVDVLWVIDDSCSMGEEQANLTANFASFIDFFVDSGLDWHVGVVSTDMDGTARPPGALVPGVAASGQEVRFITRDTPDPAAVFEQMAVLGTRGSPSERGLDATFAAVTTPGDLAIRNDGFYRREAALHVIVISDEEDASSTLGFANSFPITDSPSEFADFLRTLKADPGVPVTFSAIVTPENDPSCPEIVVESICENSCIGQDLFTKPRLTRDGTCQSNPYDTGQCLTGTDCADCGPFLAKATSSGSRYLEVSRGLPGSIEFSICEADWKPVLEQLGLLAAGLKSEFFLSEVPVIGTISAYFELDGKRWEGVDLSGAKNEVDLDATCKRRHDHKRCFGFTYDAQRNAIRTNQVIDQLAEIYIAYEVLGEQQPGAVSADTAGAP